MTDTQIIDMAARLWVSYGGDADGIEWCWLMILNRVAELLEQPQ